MESNSRSHAHAPSVARGSITRVAADGTESILVVAFG
jgi:hypothetical protein